MATRTNNCSDQQDDLENSIGGDDQVDLQLDCYSFSPKLAQSPGQDSVIVQNQY
jgi:hypothetical protein